MKLISLFCLISAFAMLAVAQGVESEAVRQMEVHVAQANNKSPYVFVRAKFEPGEVSDPWAVRFFDSAGAEIPYFVWDSVSWRIAREGREDWGKRFALINHAPGDAPEALNARTQKLEWAKTSLPALGAKLEAADQAAAANPDSMCAVMYLLRRGVSPFAKEKLTMRVFKSRQVQPEHQEWNGKNIGQRVSVEQGDLVFGGLPDTLTVAWKGKELFRYAGFSAGGASGSSSHADPLRAYTIEKLGGIITKVCVTGQTDGRNGLPMNWQSTYWLFPEGGYVALEGFSMDDSKGYRGGPQKISIWQSPADFKELHKPDWDVPWWLHQAEPGGFVASHLLYAPSLAIGYGNNPFTINAEGNGKEPAVESAGNQLALTWNYQLNDPAIARVQSPEPAPHRGVPPDSVKPTEVEWKPKIDWLYRQYLVGVGEASGPAESALRDILGAAAGWIDRPLDEETTAASIVEIIKKMNVDQPGTEFDQLIVSSLMEKGDANGAKSYLAHARDQSEKADFYMASMRDFVARGGKPAGGSHVDPDGVRREGFTGNPCYFSHLLPAYIRVFDFFELPYRREAYHAAVKRFADFSMESIAGKPFDLEKWNTTLGAEWPSRVVPAIPLMIGAYAEEPDKRYSDAATILFDDLMRLVERNPHGYFPVWTFHPGADRWDTVYNPVSYSRGLSSFWTEEKLDWIGRQHATDFVAAQVRWMVFSGQFLDTLETDNVCAIRAANHHNHTNSRTQIGLYLLDDFNFYRGLVGGVIDWSTAAWQSPDSLFPAGTGPNRSLTIETPILRWALDIHPGGKWHEYKVEKLPGQSGFKLLAWNRLPGSDKPINLTGEEIGIASPANVFGIEFSGVSYRIPAQAELARDGAKAIIKISKAAKVHLDYRALFPSWAGKSKPVLRLRNSKGVFESVSAPSITGEGSLGWDAVAGEYELHGE